VDDRGELERALELADRKDADHYRRVLTDALAQLLPGGGTFAKLYDEFLPTRRTNRQVETVRAMARKLDALGDRFDEQRILTEPYANVFEDVLEAVASRRGADKRDYYASVLANAAAVDAPEWDRQERMLACLNDIRPSHLLLLALVVRDLAANPGTSESMVGPRTGFSIPLPEGADLDLVERDWTDMVRLGIFLGLENHGMVGPSAQQTAVDHATGTPRFKGAITPFGLEFAQFVGAADEEHQEGVSPA
jgi:hypothetical protein